MEKEQSLLNWGERMREEESKQMEIFNRQKDAIIKKKMAEQSTQILLAASKGQIDNMKLEHEKALKALDTAIE
jgi:phosphoribosyl-ATP pyrophosphohydrolase